jgi:hypothetical protein
MSTLHKVLSKYGEIESIKYANSKSGYEKSYCFVIYQHPSSKQRLLNTGNLWLGDRLLSIREVQDSKGLWKNYGEKMARRCTVYGLPNKLTDNQKFKIKNLFSEMGKLEYYYYTLIRTERVDSEEILAYWASTYSNRNFKQRSHRK